MREDPTAGGMETQITHNGSMIIKNMIVATQKKKISVFFFFCDVRVDLPQTKLEEDLSWIIPHLPPTTHMIEGMTYKPLLYV